MRSFLRSISAGSALILVCGLILAGATPAAAAPVRASITELIQPDGRAFLARPFGDEWSNGFETPDGYTVVKNPQSGYWEFAVRRQGRLVPSGLRVGSVRPAALPRHLRAEAHERSLVANGAAERRAATLDFPNVGTQPSLVLLVDYNDVPGTTTAAEWNAKFFGASHSVHDWYDEVSYGELDLPPAAETGDTANDGVVGWLRIGTTHPDPAGSFAGVRQITHDAIVASDPFVNYGSFDTSPDDGFISSRELHVTVIVAGYETAYGNPCGQSTWGHNWELFGSEIPTVDGVRVGTSAGGGGYNQFGERHCDSSVPSDNHQATIGIMVHEMGHDLKLPDLYDTTGGSEGVGNWSVMASGVWTQAALTDQAGSSPVHMDAWSKWYEGWLTPQQITGTQTGVQLTENSGAVPDVVQLLDNPLGVDWTFNAQSGTGQYFLVENRQKTGYDAGLPGCGLLVWHIDETRTSSNQANGDEARKLVDLEEADGLNHLDNGVNRGDAGDPYLGPKVFNATSNPNSNLYSGAASGASVSNISSACAATMTADFTAPVPVVTHDLSVSKGGTGTGTVTGVGINCGVDCSQSYDEGTVVRLTAAPSGKSRITSWGGACTGIGIADPCDVTLDADKDVVVNFIGGTTTTLAVGKTARRIRASGSVTPRHNGKKVTVTFYKRRANGTWRKIATKNPRLNSTSRYAASFGRPASGRCKITSRFAADGDHLGSSATKQFRC